MEPILFHLNILIKVIEYMDFSHILNDWFYLFLAQYKNIHYDYRCTKGD